MPVYFKKIPLYSNCTLSFSNLCTNAGSHGDVAAPQQPIDYHWVCLCCVPFTDSLLWCSANLTLKNNCCPPQLQALSCCQWTRESDALVCVLNRWFCPRALTQKNRWLINANIRGRRQSWHMLRVSSGHCHLQMSHLLYPSFFSPTTLCPTTLWLIKEAGDTLTHAGEV